MSSYYRILTKNNSQSKLREREFLMIINNLNVILPINSYRASLLFVTIYKIYNRIFKKINIKIVNKLNIR